VHGHASQFFADVGSFLPSFFSVHRFSLLHFLVCFFLTLILRLLISSVNSAKSFFCQLFITLHFLQSAFFSRLSERAVFSYVRLSDFYFFFLSFSCVFPCFILYIYTPPADRPAVAKLDRMRRRRMRSRRRMRERREILRVWLVSPTSNTRSILVTHNGSPHSTSTCVTMSWTTVLSTTSSTLSWNWLTVRSMPEPQTSAPSVRQRASDLSRSRTTVTASSISRS
jgi:hypothetical protein